MLAGAFSRPQAFTHYGQTLPFSTAENKPAASKAKTLLLSSPFSIKQIR
jgi:hypothetical protein